MLTYELIERTDECAIYRFFPEGKEEPGEVKIYKDGRRELLKDAPCDVGMYYAIHALHHINTEKYSGWAQWC